MLNSTDGPIQRTTPGGYSEKDVVNALTAAIETCLLTSLSSDEARDQLEKMAAKA
jgi:hypothetical protein